MTRITSETLPAELHKAADTVTRLLSKMDESSVAEPSELPGWTRGHVLAHLTGISNAMARQLEYARHGETVELYDGGMDGRTKAIELAAGHSLDQHRESVTTSVGAAISAFDVLGSSDWQARIAYRDGTVFDGGLALWRELTIHAADLGMGYGPETWSRPFCEHLIGFPRGTCPGILQICPATYRPAAAEHRYRWHFHSHHWHADRHRRMACRSRAQLGEPEGYCSR